MTQELKVIDFRSGNEEEFASITTMPCLLCNESANILVDATPFRLFIEGMFVQNAFPNLSAGQREMLITGTHPECWEKLFPEEDEK